MNSKITAKRIDHDLPALAPKPPLRKKSQGCSGRAINILKQTAHTTVSIVTSIARPLIMSAIPSLFSTLLQDPAISKIVAGTGFTIGGGYLICKSSILRIAKSKLFGTRPQENVPPLTKARAVAALTGSALMLYGLHTLSCGVMELFQRRQAAQALLLEEYLKRRAICDETFEDLPGTENQRATIPDYPQEPKMREELLKHFNQCPQAKDLLQNVEQEGPIKIKFHTKDLLPVDGAWEREDRLLLVDLKAHPIKQVRIFLFEACNANNTEGFQELELQGDNGELSFFEFLKKALMNEYRAIECQHTVASKCIQSGHFHPLIIDGKYSTWPTFEAMWKDYLTNPRMEAHRKEYKNHYMRLYRDAFCKKNPKLN